MIEAADNRDWSQLGFARIAELLTERAGLVFPASRRPAAEQSMRRVMDQSGEASARMLARRLQHDTEAFDALLAEVTVGETYFFREPAQLEFIRREVLPQFRSRKPDGPLRIWSAGCASGEEAYTLAIILREDCPGVRSRIVGTEVSRPRLEAARRGRYGRWSLRSMAEPVIRQYFTQRGSNYYLRPDIQAMVDFGYLNLAGRDYPGGSLGLGRMDLIVCRNVLIYLDERTIAGVARRLLDSLDDDGWLFLGASDPTLMDLVECEVVVTGAGLAYRRHAPDRASHRDTDSTEPVSALAAVVAQGMYTTLQDGAGDPAPQLAAPPAHAAHDVIAETEPAANTSAVTPDAPGSRAELAFEAYRARDYPAASRLASEQLHLGQEDAGLRVLLVRALANSGSLSEAGQACAAALEIHPTHAELAYLHALLLAESGRLPEAATAARGALFLDRRLVVAHVLLGGVQARMGHTGAAARSFENVDRLLATASEDAIVPASDGEPVRRIREMARVQRDLMTATVN